MEKRTLKDTIIPSISMNPIQGRQVIIGWRKNKRPTAAVTALRTGNIVFIKRYNATTVPVWDINPVILIYNTSTSYVLGFNINWMTRSQKKMTINLFANECKTSNGKSLNRMQRLRIFKKLRKYQFPRSSIRLYHRSELSKSTIYELTQGEFFEAISHSLIKT